MPHNILGLDQLDVSNNCMCETEENTEQFQLHMILGYVHIDSAVLCARTWPNI